MKKLLFLFLLTGFVLSGHSQVADTSLPYYKRFPVITPFQILLTDSTTLYKKADLPSGKPVVFIIFSPDCNHCQIEAEQIVASKEQLKEMTIVMITMHPFDAMKDFATKYRLHEAPNVVVGKDIYYLMPAFYKFHNLPFHAMYDKKGNLMTVFEGSMHIGNLVTLMKD